MSGPAPVRFDWNRRQGDCVVAFDDEPIADRLGFEYGADGRLEWGLPMFHSPLGVPASFEAYFLSRPARSAIAAALQSVFPQIRGLGLHLRAGDESHGGTPPSPRAEHAAELEELQRKLGDPEFVVRVEV